MNYKQARSLQRWIARHPRNSQIPVNHMTVHELTLFRELWNEFYPDTGNIYHIPLMICSKI